MLLLLTKSTPCTLPHDLARKTSSSLSLSLLRVSSSFKAPKKACFNQSSGNCCAKYASREIFRTYANSAHGNFPALVEKKPETPLLKQLPSLFKVVVVKYSMGDVVWVTMYVWTYNYYIAW